MKYLFIIAMEKEASDIIEHYKLNKINAPMIAYPRTPAGINIATIKNNMIMILDRGSIL